MTFTAIELRPAAEYGRIAEEQLAEAKKLVETNLQVAQRWREHHEVASVTFATLALAAATLEASRDK